MRFSLKPLCRVFTQRTEGLCVPQDDVPTGGVGVWVVGDAALACTVDTRWGQFEGKLSVLRCELIHQETGRWECGKGQRKSSGWARRLSYRDIRLGTGDLQGDGSGARRKRRD